MNYEAKANEIIGDWAGTDFDQITILSPRTVSLMLQDVIQESVRSQASAENHITHQLMQAETTLRAYRQLCAIYVALFRFGLKSHFSFATEFPKPPI